MPCFLALLLGACALPARPGADARGLGDGRPNPQRPLAPEAVAACGGELSADLLAVRLELELDLDRHSLRGRVENRFRALRPETSTLVLHARGLELDRVRDGEGRALDWRLEGERLEVELPQALERGQELVLALEYRARPERGLYFVEGSDGTRQVWSQNEPQDARSWIPTWDEPNDRASFEATIRVGGGLEVLSNGVLLGTELHADGTRSFHWREPRPIPAYLFAIAAARWQSEHAEAGGVALGFHAPEGTDPAALRRAFAETRDMLEFQIRLFDEPFPWSRYDQACVDGFLLSGMENAGLTLLTSSILHGEDEELDEIGERRLLLAHELAHQWFGDLVTCFGWSNLWLNEAWASYVELLYLGRREGEAAQALWFERYRELYLARGPATRLPLSETWRAQASERRCHHEYDKGPWVLRMLEHELGHDVFWLGVRHYLDRHRDGFASTGDFGRALFDSTGRNVFPLLQQWVEGGGHPRLRARFEAAGGRLEVQIAQTQPTDELVPLFDVPLELELCFADGSRRRERLRVCAAEQRFVFEPPSSALVDLRLDPAGVLLCELELDKPAAMWARQAGPDELPAARWRALGPLRERALEPGAPGERELACDALAAVLRDGERLLRARAATACAGIPGLRPALLEQLERDPEAHVREHAVLALGSEDPSAAELARLAVCLARERSPRVRLALQRLLGTIDDAPGTSTQNTSASSLRANS